MPLVSPGIRWLVEHGCLSIPSRSPSLRDRLLPNRIDLDCRRALSSAITENSGLPELVQRFACRAIKEEILKTMGNRTRTEGSLSYTGMTGFLGSKQAESGKLSLSCPDF